MSTNKRNLFEEIKQGIQEFTNNYIVFDLETTTKEVYGRKANPWYNDIVAIGLKNKEELNSIYVYPNKIKEFKIDEDILVGHNIGFDLLYIWRLEDLQDFFKRGGKVWCTSLAEYMLTGQQHKFPALRDIAVTKYGCKEREKKMEEYWNTGVDTKDIPKELVLEDVKNDVLDTEQIYLQQIERAKQLGMFNLIELRMDGLLATIEMEYNGMNVNRDILETNMKELEEEEKTIVTQINNLSSRYWK